MEGVLASADGPATVLLTDISEQGCQIARLDGLTRDTSIRLSFAGFAPFDARVMWVSSSGAGLRFDYAAHPALIAEIVAAATGRRPANRLLVPERVRREQRERLANLPDEVSLYVCDSTGTPIRGVAARMRDLSVDGCRIEADVPLPPGTLLSVAIGEAPPLPGVVRWDSEGEIGIEFTVPSSAKDFERAA